MNSRDAFRRLVAIIAVAAGVVSLARCAQPDQATSPRSGGRSVRPLPVDRAAFAASKGALKNSVGKGRWVAEVHTAAMQDIMRDAARLRRGNQGTKGANKGIKCARVEAVARAQFAAIRAASGVSDRQVYEDALRSSLQRVNCAVPGPLSVFGMAHSRARVEGETVTGAYDQYTSALLAAVDGAATPSAAESSLNAVLVEASSLPPADYAVLSGIASLAASSMYYWYDVENSGGAPPPESGDNTSQIQTMSIFRARAAAMVPGEGHCNWWCRVGWSDLIGSIGGAAAVILTAGPGVVVVPQAVLIGAAIGGIVNSATTAIT